MVSARYPVVSCQFVLVPRMQSSLGLTCSDLFSSLHRCHHHYWSLLFPAADPKCLIVSDSRIWAWLASPMHLHFHSLLLLGWILSQKQKKHQTPLKISTLSTLENVLGELLCIFHFAFVSFRLWRLMLHYYTPFIHKKMVSKCNVFPVHFFFLNCTKVGYITLQVPKYVIYKSVVPFWFSYYLIPKTVRSNSCKLLVMKLGFWALS